MSENPYQTPPANSKTDTSLESSKAPSRPVRWRVMFGLTFGSHLVATLVSPADPMSNMIATVPITAIALLGYYLGRTE